MKRQKQIEPIPASKKLEGVRGVAPAGKRILIVDDDSSVREMLGRVLAGEGYLISSAADGVAALVVAASDNPDLVLLDLNLPGKSGWDTFEQLTAQNPLLAVIIVTARSNQLFTTESAGVGALLEKPLDFPKLLKTVSGLLAEPAEARLASLTGAASGIHYIKGQTNTARSQQS